MRSIGAGETGWNNGAHAFLTTAEMHHFNPERTGKAIKPKLVLAVKHLIAICGSLETANISFVPSSSQ